MLREVLLAGVGLILPTHAHTDWTDLVRRATRPVGFAPRHARRDGAIALGYGVLEAVEGYGLLRRRPWSEYLTVVSTALLLLPEVQELFKHPTRLKVGGLTLNVVIVIYLIIRLIRRARQT